MNTKKIPHPILYIDDEEDNLTVFNATFRRDYEIHVAISGKKGLEIMKEHDIHLVITDQRMPEMTGVEFLERIIPDYPDCIRMVLTGFSDMEAIIQAINKGRVYRYITKPWNREEFKITMDRALETFDLKIQNKKLIEDLKEANRNLEQKVIERTKQIEKQKNEIKQQYGNIQTTLKNLRETQMQLVQAEKLAALGGLVTGVAHEINTPVGISITAASSLMEETERMADHYNNGRISQSEFKDYLNTTSQSAKLILSNMEKTAALVQSFKLVSIDQSTEQQRTFRLKEYSEDIIRSLHPRLKDKKIRIILDIDEKMELKSYPGAFSQIITNLLLNSLVHGFEGKDEGNITISAIHNKTQLELNYRDDGKGIPKENLDKIFDPFFTTNKQAGAGLGLHIVYNLVHQKLNGSIYCSRENQSGAHFNIKIPV
jgi:C4-dicarboxylate-specific signal transduction histidine kinase